MRILPLTAQNQQPRAQKNDKNPAFNGKLYYLNSEIAKTGLDSEALSKTLLRYKKFIEHQTNKTLNVFFSAMPSREAKYVDDAETIVQNIKVEYHDTKTGKRVSQGLYLDDVDAGSDKHLGQLIDHFENSIPEAKRKNVLPENLDY